MPTPIHKQKIDAVAHRPVRISEYLAWLFKPSLILLPPDQKEQLQVFEVPGWETLQFVSDPDKLKELNRAIGTEYFGGRGNGFLTALFGAQSVFTLDGDMHRLARRVIAPALTQARVEELRPALVAIVEAEVAIANRKRKINAGQLARTITMRAACLAILGITDRNHALQLLQRFEAVTGFLANIVSYRKAFWSGGPFPLNLFVNRRIGRVRNSVDALIDTARIAGGKGGSVLDALVAGQTQGGYGDVFIRDNLVATLAAGYDTTGSAVTWMLFWLSQADNFAVLQHRSDEIGREAALDQFVSETLRYCPPLEILPRAPGENATVADGATMVCACPLRTHHDPKIFASPEKFDPARFDGRHYKLSEYYPFGSASRLCLGINIAPVLMKLLLGHLLDSKMHYRFDKRRFSPVRRNVSLWPSVRNRATPVPSV